MKHFIFNINALAIMQGIRDNEQIKTKWLGVDDLGLNLQKIVLCSLCVTPAIVFYFVFFILFYNHGSYFALVLSYVNIIFKSFPLRS